MFLFNYLLCLEGLDIEFIDFDFVFKEILFMCYDISNVGYLLLCLF